MAAMTILDEIQTNIRQHAEGAGSSVVGIGQRWGGGLGSFPGGAGASGPPGAPRVPGGLDHPAPLRPASSGAPALAAGGRLLGANTTRLGGGFSLAIPADEALRAQAVALA